MRELRQAEPGGPRWAGPPGGSARGSRLCGGRRDERRLGSMLAGGVLAGAVVAQVVDIHAVDDVGDAARWAGPSVANSSSLQWKQRSGRCAGSRGSRTRGLDVFVAESDAAREFFGVALMGLRDRGGIRGDGQGLVAQRLMGGPGQVGRIRSPGIGDDHAPQARRSASRLASLERRRAGSSGSSGTRVAITAAGSPARSLRCRWWERLPRE